jgi:hypothetical protein
MKKNAITDGKNCHVDDFEDEWYDGLRIRFVNHALWFITPTHGRWYKVIQA